MSKKIGTDPVAIFQSTNKPQISQTSTDLQPPATTQPRPDEITNYTVPADQPRLITIPAINVRARVFSLGVDSMGRIDVPKNTNDTGWFNQSAKPGQLGVMLIDGHVSSRSHHGVFHDLSKLKNGDSIVIEKGDHTTSTYLVEDLKVYPYDQVDMEHILGPPNATHPALHLITCSGSVIKGTTQFDSRTVVFAKQR